MAVFILNESQHFHTTDRLVLTLAVPVVALTPIFVSGIGALIPETSAAANVACTFIKLGRFLATIANGITIAAFDPVYYVTATGFVTNVDPGLAAGFYFNDYHDWWWRTFHYSFLVGIAFAFAGGLLIGRSPRELKKCPRWMPLLTIPLFIALAFALFVCIPHSYYSYSDPHSNPYPYFYDYSGDYFYKTLTILAFDILVPLGLFAGFALGFAHHPKVR
jgi:hypothetical protein